MPTRLIDGGGPLFDCWYSWWSGRESVSSGEKLLSEKRGFRLFTNHVFAWPYQGNPASWHLRSMGPIEWALFRNGVLVSSGVSRWWLFFLSFGISLFVIHLLADVYRGLRDGLGAGASLWSGSDSPTITLGALVLAVLLSYGLRRALLKPPGKR